MQKKKNVDHRPLGFNGGIDTKVFFRLDISTGEYSMVLRFPDSEFIIGCCVHMYDDFRKVKPDVTLVHLVPHTVDDKAKAVSDIINQALNKK
jgi:hypothetical protein